MNAIVTALTLGVLSLGQDARAQDAEPGAATAAAPSSAVVYDGERGQLDVPSPWVPEESIDIDGRIDEVLWETAPVLTGFTQFEPVEGVPATQRTEARVLMTDDAILFAIKAFEDDPDGIRATLGERDSYARSDDYVRVVMDTFDDRRRAYVLMVNPLGVQQDGLWVEGGGGRGRGGGFGPPIDWNPDFVWESGGQLHEWGYSVELKVPFKSLRFREIPLQNWGLQIERQIQRNGYGSSWAPVSGNVSNKMEQFGSLTSLRNLDPGLFMEINPVQTLTRQGAYDDDLGAFERDPVTGEFGLNMTYGLTSNLTLDGTYNPDFSQVEADAGQISVNERFAVFFPEKRPFFLEGTEIFNLPQQLVYTRSIVNPVGGAKLTGKVGSFNVGYLGAVDDVLDPDEDDDDGTTIKPVVNLLRVRRDLGTSSTLGMVYTDRTVDASRYNRVGGIDGRFIFNQRNTVTFMAAGSRTGEAPGTASGGSLFALEYDRSGRNFQARASIEDMSPDFEAGSGFLRRIGDTELRSRVGYDFRGSPGDLVERWGPNIEVESFWNHDDFWAGRGLEEAKIQLGGSVSFRNNITLFGNVSRSYFSFHDTEYAGLRTGAAGATPFLPDQSLFQGLNSGTLFLWVSTFDRARGNLRLTRSETPLFEGNTSTPVDVADRWSGDLSLNLFPTTNLSAEVGLRHESLFRKRDGSRFSDATIPRIRAQYQFTRALGLRTIVEYGSETRGEMRDPVTGEALSYCDEGECEGLSGSETNDVSVETLLSYEPTPGTVFFIGYSRQMEDIGAFRFRDTVPQADGVFVKLSYRFRM